MILFAVRILLPSAFLYDFGAWFIYCIFYGQNLSEYLSNMAATIFHCLRIAMFENLVPPVVSALLASSTEPESRPQENKILVYWKDASAGELVAPEFRGLSLFSKSSLEENPIDLQF